MNKKEFISEISERTEISKKDVATVIDTFQDVVKDAVSKGDKISITGFLTFDKKHVPAKSGISKIGGVEKPWSTDEKDEISVKISKTYKVI